MEDFTEIKKHLIYEDQDFHTFTPKNEKTLAFVLKGLENNTTVKEIMDELKKNEVSVKNVCLIKGTRSVLYLVVTGSDIMMQSPQKIPFITYIKIK